MKKKIRNTAKYNRFSVFDAVNYGIMTLMMVAILIPFIHMIAVSLSDNFYTVRNQVGLWPKGFTLQTYIDVFKNGDFIRAYGNTIFYTVTHTTLAVAVTAMGAYALARRKLVGHKLFSVMITFTMFFHGGIIPTYILIRDLQMIDTVWAMIIPGIIGTFNLIILRSFFVAYPQEIVESGQLDGLQESGVFFRLVLPTSKAALSTIALYYGVAKWNSYIDARLYLRDEAFYPLQHFLQQLLADIDVNGGGDDAALVPAAVRYASIMIATAPIMCVYPFIQKYFVKGVMVGSIKG